MTRKPIRKLVRSLSQDLKLIHSMRAGIDHIFMGKKGSPGNRTTKQHQLGQNCLQPGQRQTKT